MELGAAWYSLRTEDHELRAGLNRAEGMITSGGDRAGRAGGQGIARGLALGGREGADAAAKAAAGGAGRMEQTFQQSAGRIGGFLKSQVGGAIGAIAAIFAASKAVMFISDAINAASDLAETQSKVDVVFGKSAETVLKMGENSATALGMSENAALSAAGTYGNLFRAMGIAEDASASMSTGLVKLAADLASFNNMDPTEVLDKLRAGLSGETEPLRTLGVNLNQARIEQEALSRGLWDGNGAISAAAKAQATYSLILQDTKLAQGDFSRTQGGLANQQRILQAQFADLTARIGKGLLPVMVTLARFANDTLVPALINIVDALGGVGDGLGEAADGISDFITYAQIRFGDLGKTVADRAKEIGLAELELKNRTIELMTEWGLSFSEALEQAERELQGLPPVMSDASRKALAAWKQADLGTAVADDVGAAAGAVEESGLAESIEGEVTEGAAAAIDEAAKLPGQIADAIISGSADLDPVRDKINEIIAGAVSDSATLAANAALLVSPKIAQAFKGNSSQAKDAMLTEIVEPLVTSMNELGPNALISGQGIPEELRAGIFANRDLAIDEVTRLRDEMAPEMDLAEFARQAGLDGIAALIDGMEAKERDAKLVAGAIAVRAANQLDASSTAFAGGYATGSAFMNGITAAFWANNPEVVTAMNYMRRQLGGSLPEIGPLKGDTAERGGRSVGSSWTGALVNELRQAAGLVQDPLRSIAGMLTPSIAGLVPQLAVPQFAPAGAAAGSAGNIPTAPPGRSLTVHLHAEGRQVPVETESDLERIVGRVVTVNDWGGQEEV